MSIESKIKELNIIIPDAPSPVGSYVASKTIGNLLFISGQISLDKDNKLIKGKLGLNLSTEEGYEAAKRCAYNIIAQAKKACKGDLDKIKNCVKLTGFVNSTDSFIDQPKVINGASDLISLVFEKKGEHIRAAVSTNSLPLGVAVEVDAIFEIK
jgi:enamine deaminase RidA (YjgF/YER057c/UK114 family)|tara:strand:+ start:5734 stop:6195 length:462 start_codon:yes stop_codon:yes gene_type:complete